MPLAPAPREVVEAKTVIPYIEIPSLHIAGPFNIEPFGVLVVTGVWLGAWLCRRRAQEAGISDDEMVNAMMWAVGVGFVGAHWVEVIFYHPYKFQRDGILTLFKLWDGISSYGGFFGALAGLTIYFRFVNRKPWLQHAEIIIQGLVLGWIFGRMGCSVAHDHPGQVSDFFLAVQYPNGTRHDLGFYEFLYTLLVLFPAMLLLHRFRPPKGSYLGLALLLYSPMRFGLDFLRIGQNKGGDRRYLELTPAQWGTVATFCLGLYFISLAWRNRGEQSPSPAPVGTRPATSGGTKKKRKRNKK